MLVELFQKNSIILRHFSFDLPIFLLFIVLKIILSFILIVVYSILFELDFKPDCDNFVQCPILYDNHGLPCRPLFCDPEVTYHVSNDALVNQSTFGFCFNKRIVGSFVWRGGWFSLFTIIKKGYKFSWNGSERECMYIHVQRAIV